MLGDSGPRLVVELLCPEIKGELLEKKSRIVVCLLPGVGLILSNSLCKKRPLGGFILQSALTRRSLRFVGLL